ncbi:MAG: domain S-box protein [Sediminibacterium sp.]|nr:domain S-box protein [Sediminibacterium sp.]
MKKQNLSQSVKPDRKIRLIFTFSLLALVLFMAVLYQQKNRQEQSRAWLNHTSDAISNIDTISILFSESESAARSYVATKNPEWKAVVHRLHSYLDQSIARLSLTTSDNERQRSNIEKLKDFCNRNKLFQDTLLSDGFTPTLLLEKLDPSGNGPQLTRAVKTLLASIRQIENDLLYARMAQNERSYNNSIYTAVFGGVFAFVLVLVILFKLNRDIYRRRKAEEEVAVNEEKYRNLIENIGAVMYTSNERGIVSFSNQRVSELTGYTVEELSGKHFGILLDPEWTERVLSFYVEQFRNRIPTTHLEFAIRTKNGEKKWVEQTSQLLYDNDEISGFQCMVKDITEQKQIEEELNESESARKENEFRLNSILNNTTTLVFIKDLEGRYTMVNRRFKEVFNLTDEMVINRTDYDFNTEEQADHYLKLDEEVIAARKPVQVEETIETSEGRRTLLLVKFPLLDDKQQVFGISGIATDITEKIQSTRQLEVALKNAEEAKELQEQFLANMSHEIRTPLNGIQGMTTLLSETELNSEQREFTSTISRSLNNLLAIVNNILDFSNIKTGKLALLNKPFNLRDAIASVKNQFDYQFKKKGLALEVVIGEQVPTLVTGDVARLKQVLVNLVDNAVKFTDSGFIRIEVFLLEHTEEETKLSFTITDTGIGIARDKFETIFKSFAQANIDISQGYGGAGLGLAISKGLVELQGGNISVHSQLNKGSAFRFIMIYGSVKEESRDAVAKNDFSETLKNKHFLVVEDNPVNQRLVSVVLQKVGSKVDLAANGKEAIERLKMKPDYDLVLMDVQMPVMGGYETTIYIREVMQLQMPIIALTATALKEDQDRCKEVGMNDFILKPFDFKDLYNRLTRLLLNKAAFPQNASVTKTNSLEKLYDLSLLEELDDKRYVYDMILFFLENITADIVQLSSLCDNEDWQGLYKLAHKIKGAIGMMQSRQLLELLAKIESDAKAITGIDTIGSKVKEVVRLFAVLEKQLQEELVILKKELPATDGS